MYKVDNQWKCAVLLRELKRGLCNNLEGVGRGGRLKRKGTHVYLQLTHVDYGGSCEVIFLQLSLEKNVKF